MDTTNRLPATGAGFVWDTSGEVPMLRPRTLAAVATYTTRLSGDLRAHPDPAWTLVHQVHGGEVVEAKTELVDADGLYTADPSKTLAVLSADCVLLLMTGPRGIAVAHAGWRGMVAGVVQNAIASVGATEVFAGPAIGPCCFEVGPEVIEAFEPLGAVADDRHVDLWAAAEDAAGDASFHAARLCTSCYPDLFFSHRRDKGDTGRQALVARLA